MSGASGNVGSKVIANLKATDTPIRALVRSEEQGRALDVAFAVGDFSDPDALDAALRGIDTAFLACRAGPDHVALETAFVDACARAGVGHVVKLSAIGVDVAPDVRFIRGHAQIEAALDRSGLARTHLRPVSFMDRLLGHVPTVQADDTLAAPMGHGRVAWVDARDVAEFAAAVLRSPADHAGKAYPLTGPEAFSLPEVAELIGDLLGRRIRYADISDDEAVAAFLAGGAPEWSAQGRVELYRWYREDDVSLVSPLLPVLLGKRARTLPDFLEEHRQLFEG